MWWSGTAGSRNRDDVHTGVDGDRAVVGGDQRATPSGSATHRQVAHRRAPGNSDDVRHRQGSRRSPSRSSGRVADETGQAEASGRDHTVRGSASRSDDCVARRSVVRNRSSHVGPDDGSRICTRSPSTSSSRSPTRPPAMDGGSHPHTVLRNSSSRESGRARASSDGASQGRDSSPTSTSDSDSDASAASRTSSSSSARTEGDSCHGLLVGIDDGDGPGSSPSQVDELQRSSVGGGGDSHGADGGEAGHETDDTLAQAMTTHEITRFR
jgi:hypothetical protein